MTIKPTTRVFLRDEKNEKFFGEGPCRLLKGIENTGSLRAAAQEMNMAYTKALHLVRHAEEVLDFSLTEKTIGGKGGGGSRLTPPAREFIRKYEAYRDACYAANAEIYQRIFFNEDMPGEERQKEEFPKKDPQKSLTPQSTPPLSPAPAVGCVLMASGMSRRFQGNKLLADFNGRPLIAGILAATDTALFAKRIVVTRHAKIADLCRSRGIETVLHDLPDRNDTVRLGLEALERAFPQAAGCMFCPCDQPLLSKETLEAMIRAFAAQPAHIYRPSYAGTPGSPVLFPRSCFQELKNLPKGSGGVSVIQAHGKDVRLVEAGSALELEDVDTKEDLAYLLTALS